METSTHIFPATDGTNPIRIVDMGGATLSQAVDHGVHINRWRNMIFPRQLAISGRLDPIDVTTETDSLNQYSLDSFMTEMYDPNPKITIRRLLTANMVIAAASDEDGKHCVETVEAVAVRNADPEVSTYQCWDDDEYEDEDEDEDEDEELDEEIEDEDEDEDEDEELDEESEDEELDEEIEDEDEELDEDEESEDEDEELVEEVEVEPEPEEQDQDRKPNS